MNRLHVCCCGHIERDHIYGIGQCRRCLRGCLKFHRVGEGHAPLWFVALCVGLVFWATWAIVRTSERHAQIPPEIRALVKKG